MTTIATIPLMATGRPADEERRRELPAHDPPAARASSRGRRVSGPRPRCRRRPTPSRSMTSGRMAEATSDAVMSSAYSAAVVVSATRKSTAARTGSETSASTSHSAGSRQLPDGELEDGAMSGSPLRQVLEDALQRVVERLDAEETVAEPLRHRGTDRCRSETSASERAGAPRRRSRPTRPRPASSRPAASARGSSVSMRTTNGRSFSCCRMARKSPLAASFPPTIR